MRIQFRLKVITIWINKIDLTKKENEGSFSTEKERLLNQLFDID